MGLLRDGELQVSQVKYRIQILGAFFFLTRNPQPATRNSFRQILINLAEDLGFLD
jgi:hypothetical protein